MTTTRSGQAYCCCVCLYINKKIIKCSKMLFCTENLQQAKGLTAMRLYYSMYYCFSSDICVVTKGASFFLMQIKYIIDIKIRSGTIITS